MTPLFPRVLPQKRYAFRPRRQWVRMEQRRYTPPVYLPQQRRAIRARRIRRQWLVEALANETYAENPILKAIRKNS